MLIDLSEVLSEPHKSIDEVVGTEMKEVKVNGSRFPVSRTQPVHIHVEYAGEKKLHISCETSLGKDRSFCGVYERKRAGDYGKL